MENLQTISNGLKNLNFTKDPINKYIKDIKQQAEDLIMNQFPRRFLELEESLKTLYVTPSESASACNQQIWETNLQSEYVDSTASRKRKRCDDLDLESKSNHVKQIIKCNNFIIDEIELIKPHIRQLLEDIQLLKIWIQFLTPRSEDANDSIKSLLDEILGEILAIEDSSKTFSDQISAHFLSRGKVITKVMKYPQLDDYRRTVQEMDENFRRLIQQTLSDIRNNYAILHDIITKNWQKVKNPRKFDPRSMY